MNEIHPLPKFVSPLISYIFGEDTTSVPGIICGTVWGSFPLLGSFAVQFGDHLRYGDHLRAGIICGPVHPYNFLVSYPLSLKLFCQLSLIPKTLTRPRKLVDC